MNNQNEPIVFGNGFDKPKKPNRKNNKTLWIILCSIIGFFILVAAIGGNSEGGSESDSTGTPSNEMHTEAPTSKPEFEMTFFLKAGTESKYGKTITYNVGTEFEESVYAYYVPYGKYIVKNVGDYPTQVNAYSDEIATNESGLEEPAECSVITLQVGEEKELIVPEGWHIEITEPTAIQMQKIKENSNSQDKIPDEEIVSYKVVDTYYRFGRLKSNSMYVWVACFSIVENTGNTNLFLSQGDFEICTKSGTILGRKSVSSAYPMIISPGEKGVYYCELNFYHNEFTTESYDFVITPDLNVQKTTIEEFDLDTSNVTLSTQYDIMYLRGNVANNTDQDVENCYVICFLYDESDKIIGVIASTISDIPAGRNMNFEITDIMNLNEVDPNEVKRTEVIAVSVDLNY